MAILNILGRNILQLRPPLVLLSRILK